MAGQGSKKYVARVGMIECSTIFLNLMWVLRTLNMTGTKAYVPPSYSVDRQNDIFQTEFLSFGRTCFVHSFQRE
jgi:hypothetical protein